MLFGRTDGISKWRTLRKGSLAQFMSNGELDHNIISVTVTKNDFNIFGKITFPYLTIFSFLATCNIAEITPKMKGVDDNCRVRMAT